MRDFTRYALSGCGAAATDFTTYSVCTLGFGLDPQAAWSQWASKLAFRVIKRRSARALAAEAA